MLDRSLEERLEGGFEELVGNRKMWKDIAAASMAGWACIQHDY